MEKDNSSPLPIASMASSPIRSRSVIELSKNCVDDFVKYEDVQVHVQNSSPSDSMDPSTLLVDYERSKRGFRSNPFLKTEPKEGDDFKKTNKDSDARRQAWAQTLDAVLDSVLQLSVIVLMLR